MRDKYARLPARENTVRAWEKMELKTTVKMRTCGKKDNLELSRISIVATAYPQCTEN